MNIERLSPTRLEAANRNLIDSVLAGKERTNVYLSEFGIGRMPVVRSHGKNPIVANIMEVINQPVYDSVSFAAAAAMAKTVLFQTPIGQAGKTLAITNMTKAGQLEQPQKLVIRAIGLYVTNNTVPVDLQNFLSNVSFVLTVGKKPMLECPAWNLTAGRGGIVTAAAQIATAIAGNTPVIGTSNGIADPRSVFTLNQPIVIEGGEGFAVTLNPETAFNFAAAGVNPPGNGATIAVYLDGELYRGVQ